MNITTIRLNIFTLILVIFFPLHLHGEIKHSVVKYKFQDTTLQGYLAWDDKFTTQRPGILVVHEWWGLNDYAKMRAEQLASLGYVAFAADMYGNGKVAEHPTEAKEMMSNVNSNIKTWLGRAEAALTVLRKNRFVDKTKLGAIGYCFGGATVLQMAYAGNSIDGGENLKAVVSFHGALPVPDSTEKIHSKILICHGAKDNFSSEETIAQLKTKLDEGRVDYSFLSYDDAVHGFTVPGAEKRGIPGVAYNEAADKKSWQDMQDLFSKSGLPPPINNEK